MTQALWAVGGAGAVALVFVLGVLWERRRRVAPPSIYEVHLIDETPPREGDDPR